MKSRHAESKSGLSRQEQEIALLRRVQDGDREAFATVYRDYHPRLYAYLFRFLADRCLVEEVLDDVMFVVWKDALKFRQDCQFSTWIFVIAYRQALSALRQRLRDNEHAVPAVTWIGDGKSIPPWISNNSANIQVKYRVSNVETMLEVARQGIAIAQLPCVVGDTEPNVRRIPNMAAESGSGLWILSHVDLRLTARVRIFRDFMRKAFEPLVPLIEGNRPISGAG